MALLLNILWFIFGGGFLAWILWVLLEGFRYEILDNFSECYILSRLALIYEKQ